MPTAANLTAPDMDIMRRHGAVSSPARLSESYTPQLSAVGVPRFLSPKVFGVQPVALHGQAGAPAVSGSVPRYLQAKLDISQPGDACEQEADRAAERIMRLPHPSVQQPGAAGQGNAIYRQAEAASSAGTPFGPSAGVSASVDVGSLGTHPPAQMSNSPDGVQGTGQALPNAARQFFSSRMGADFSDVRIHRDMQAAQMSADLHARAFTYGNHIAFAPGEYDADSGAGRHLLAHELTHVLQQRGRTGRMVQRDLALHPPTTAVGPGPTLNQDEKKAAIAYNTLRFKGIAPKVMRSAEDIAGVRRDSTALDEVFVTAVAGWQNWWNLQVDGKMTPMTARIFASELRAEAKNLRKWKASPDIVDRFDASAKVFDEIAAGPFRAGAVAKPASAGSWSPPYGVDKLRVEIGEDLSNDPAAAVPMWRERAYVIRASSSLSEDDRGEYLAEISARLSGIGKMSEAMEAVSLIDVVSESARTQMGTALSRVANNAATNETYAKDYLKMLLRLTGVESKDVPADPQAWLENNTEAVGQAIRAMERVLGSDIARQLSGSVLKASFSKDPNFTVDPSGPGHISNLPKDPNAGRRLLADCDVYAVYGMRLLRAQGWETVGYFTFQGDAATDIAHAVGLARRKTADNKTEYVVIDSMKSSFVVHLGNMSGDAAAKTQADKSGNSWAHHFYAPAVGGGAIDARLNTLHPTELRYPPAGP